MRNILKGLGYIGAELGIVIICIACILCMVRWIKAKQIKITTPNGIQENSYVNIGGIEQYIQIRGEDKRNPVIVFLHGGPGNTIAPL